MKTVKNSLPTLPLPKFYDPKNVGELRFVNYPVVLAEAREYAKRYALKPVATDSPRICVVPIDVQGTFTMLGGGLVVDAALDATVLACEWGYRNMHRITKYIPTMDTHLVWQIFHECFLVDADGNHPDAMTQVTDEGIRSGKWQLNPAAVANVLNDASPGGFTYLREFLQYYCDTLKAAGKYSLTTWPYHALLGGMEHALVPLLHEQIFFWEIARQAQRLTTIKGGNPMTENYSPLMPEVMVDQKGVPFAQKSTKMIEALLSYDYIIPFGFASSHCFAWFVDNLLGIIMAQDPKLVSKVYLMKNCTKPVNLVIPGVVDFPKMAEEAFARFEKAGMHVVDSTTPMEQWPGMKLD